MNSLRFFCLLFSLILVLAIESRPDEYIAIGPCLGYYRTNDTVGQFNDVIKVRGRLRFSRLGIEVSTGHKNEIYKNDLVSVKSWPIQVSAAYYPLSFVYISGGGGLYDLYIDYNQSIDALQFYENESKKKFGVHAAFGIEKRISKTTLLSLEINKVWIDYDFRELPTTSPLDTNSLAVEATLFFQIGVDD